jgi:hypothetical protein
MKPEPDIGIRLQPLTLYLNMIFPENRFPIFGIMPYRLMRAEAGCPGTLKRLPVSVTLVPLTFRIEKS